MKKQMLALGLITSLVCGTFSVEAHSMSDVGDSETTYIESSYGQAIKLFDIAYGDGDENLRRTEIKVDSKILTPKSFTVDEAGNFYILDTLNDKIKVYSETGTYKKSITLPFDLYGLDIEKINENIFVYADDCNLYKINEQNSDNIELVTNISRENIAGIYSVDDDLFVRSYNGVDKKITITDNSSAMRSNIYGFDIVEDDTVIGLNNTSDTKLLRLNQGVSYNLSCVLEPAGAYCLKKEDNCNSRN